MRSAASCRAGYRPRATGTRVAVRFVCRPASNGTIVANPRRRRGTTVTSSRCVGLHFSSPSPCWQRIVVDFSEIHECEPRRDPQHSQKISRASSRIGRSSGKIGQLRTPRPSWCSTFGSGMLIRFISQSMSSHRSDSVSEGVRRPP